MSDTASVDDTTTAASPVYEFDATTQTELCSLTMWDGDFLRRTDGLIKPEYFENEIERILVGMSLEHYRKYREAPSVNVWKELFKDAVKVTKRIRDDQKIEAATKLQETGRVVIRSRAWLLDATAEFARQQAVLLAFISGSSTLYKMSDPNRFTKIQKLMQSAFSIGLATVDEDYNYFARIEERTRERHEVMAGGRPKTGVTTGVPELDDLLMHAGWGLKELSLLIGGAKSTKSFHLSFFGAKAVEAGYNTLIISLENSKEILSTRLDAQFSGVGISEQFKSPDTMEIGVKNTSRKIGLGELRIREGVNGTFRPADLRRIIDEYKSKGIVFKLLVIDYMDLMAPDVKTDDKIENSKSVFVTVRGIAQEENMAVLSASQLTRAGHNSAVAKATDVAEDFNRVRIADLVLAINRTEDEKADNKSRITFAAARNQSDGNTLFIKQDLEHGLAIDVVESVE